MLSEIEVLAIMIFGIIPWIEIEIKEDKDKSEVKKVD